MSATDHPQRRVTLLTTVLLGAAVVLYVAGPFVAPAALRDLYELDAIAEKYAAVADETAMYRWANLAAALGAVAGALGVHRLTESFGRASALERFARGGLLGAAAGWVILAALRIVIVAGRADEVADGRSADGGTVADVALRGDGPFIVVALLAGASLLALALEWWRARPVSRVAVVLVGLGGITTALLARSDPAAIVFIPPFPFFLAFLPLAVVGARRTAGQPRFDHADAHDA